MRNPGTMFVPDLNELKPGDLSLSVPVENDVIQIYVVKAKELVNLAVHVGAKQIRIARQDKRPLQIEINRFGPGKSYEMVRVPVLRSPVDELLLSQAAGYCMWKAKNDAEIADQDGLYDFTSTVAGYAINKQTKPGEN